MEGEFGEGFDFLDHLEVSFVFFLVEEGLERQGIELNTG